MEAPHSRAGLLGWWTAVRLRRLSQGFILAAFLVLLSLTRDPGGAGEGRLGWPVRIFLETDPFVALSQALATHALYRGLAWSLVIVIPTLFLGRFFCGWICPLGTLSQMVGWLRRGAGRSLVEANRYKRWQKAKYYLLGALLAAAVFRSSVAGLFDPISLTVRSLALTILPASGYGMRALAAELVSSPYSWVRFLAKAIQYLCEEVTLSMRQPYYRQGFLLLVVFVSILAVSLWVTRFWCRALCPLGALLGLISRWSILGLEKHPAKCDNCNRCLLGCQGGDDPIPGAAWRKAECHLCLNCVGDCPESGLKFRLFPERAETVVKPDLKRRAVLGSLGGGAALVPLLRTTPGFAAERGEKNIRPPGALDEGPFLARCIRCGTCMKVCPNNALQPALGEAGVEGLWTPVVAPRIGYCASSCTLCGEVCPTGAIRQFTSKEKGWVGGAGEGQPIRIGTAFYDRGRCLPWAMARECIVCEEWCPTSPKAIYLVPAEAPDSAGQKATVRQPYIDPLRCVGCGACEYACPLVSGPAVYVTRVGESRSGRQEILGSRAGKADSWLPQSGEVAGWVRAGEPRIFAAEDLWKHIDGDAERYLKAGVRKTWNGRYRFEGRFEASADVYEMAGDEGAQAVFEAEPATGSREVAVGEAGRSFGQVLVFQRGRFLVRVVAYEEGAGVGEAVLGLGKGIERRLLRSADALRQP